MPLEDGDDAVWLRPRSLRMRASSTSFFDDGIDQMALDLVDTTVIPPGVAILTYRPQR